MMDDNWVKSGASDDDASASTIPAFIEVGPDSFKPIHECTVDELTAAADSLMLQAKQAMDDARALYELAERPHS